jgi:hypothetical protein
MFCPSVFPTLSHRRITIALGDRFVNGQLICYPNKGEVKGRVWRLSPCPRPSKQRGPASSASNTSTSIAGVPGEVSRQQVACFFPVASYGCSLTRWASPNCWAYPTCRWRVGGWQQLSQKGQSKVCRKTAEWVPLRHSHDGRIRFATNSLGRNVAKTSGVSASRNEQSSGCSHCPILPNRADCSIMAALRFIRRAS